MKILTTNEIDMLYKKYDVNQSAEVYVRSRINTGTMDNGLNTGTLLGKADNNVKWTNSAVSEKTHA